MNVSELKKEIESTLNEYMKTNGVVINELKVKTEPIYGTKGQVGGVMSFEININDTQ